MDTEFGDITDCIWYEDEEGNWDTGCDQSFVFFDGGPSENGMRFCCYCGKSIFQSNFVISFEDEEV